MGSGCARFDYGTSGSPPNGGPTAVAQAKLTTVEVGETVSVRRQRLVRRPRRARELEVRVGLRRRPAGLRAPDQARVQRDRDLRRRAHGHGQHRADRHRHGPDRGHEEQDEELQEARGDDPRHAGQRHPARRRQARRDRRPRRQGPAVRPRRQGRDLRQGRQRQARSPAVRRTTRSTAAAATIAPAAAPAATGCAAAPARTASTAVVAPTRCSAGREPTSAREMRPSIGSGAASGRCRTRRGLDQAATRRAGRRAVDLDPLDPLRVHLAQQQLGARLARDPVRGRLGDLLAGHMRELLLQHVDGAVEDLLERVEVANLAGQRAAQAEDRAPQAPSPDQPASPVAGIERPQGDADRATAAVAGEQAARGDHVGAFEPLDQARR